MRALLKLLITLVLLGVLALLSAVWFVLQDNPLVEPYALLSPQDTARARTLLEHKDPRRTFRDDREVIVIDASDLELLVRHLLDRLGGSARVGLARDRLDIAATIPIPYLPRRNNLNIVASLDATHGRPGFRALRIGSLQVPPKTADSLARWMIEQRLGANHPDANEHPLGQLEIHPDGLRLSRRSNAAAGNPGPRVLSTGTTLEALRFYHDLLVEQQDRGIGRTGALVALLEPMFRAAEARSIDRDPVEENTALLTLLGAWASQRGLDALVPDRPRRPSGFLLKLQGRRDFARHFLASAALAARSNGSLSNAVGLFKEITDAGRGSGFSFTDIAANRAGTRFGELAGSSPRSARDLQRRLAVGITDSDLMPAAADLPEHLDSDAFRQRFGHVGSPAYQAVMREIEQRIDASGLYRDR
jgi:hypothetical protein